jgi:PhnB protein
MTLEPYLFFNGRCEEAMDFYQQAIGAEVSFKMRMHEAPEPPAPGSVPEGFDGQKIMHASLRIGAMNLLVTDGNSDMQPSFKGFSLTLGVDDTDEAHRKFDALAQGGKVVMPLSPTFWSPCFGMLEDKFGVGWMVIVPPAEEA